MSKFKVGDKVRVLSNNSGAVNELSVLFDVGDTSVVHETDNYGSVRISDTKRSWIDVEELELVEEENKVYTEEDIYEGMVLECVETKHNFWTVGKRYIVDKRLNIQDDDEDVYWHVGEIIDFLNSNSFKVVEPSIVSILLADNNMIVNQKHYTNNDIQPIEIMKANFTIDEYRGFLLGNIVKYPLRYRDKNGLEDLKKTNTYLTWLIQDIEERGL